MKHDFERIRGLVEMRWPEGIGELMQFLQSFVILSAFQPVPYLLWDGVDIFCYHRKLAYIFSPKACGVMLSKASSQRLSGWRVCLAQFSYVV